MSKKKCPEFENHERWLVSYADMLTLLFAVFVTLYALNLSDDKKPPIDELVGSMQESFATPLEDIPVNRRIGPTEAGYGIFEHFQGTQARPPISKKFPSGDRDSVRVIKDEMNRVNMALEQRLYGPNKFVGSSKPGEQRIVEVKRTGKGFKLQLMAQHFYDPGGIQIKPAARSSLDEVIKILKELGRDITIEGHTDSVPPKGQMTNWELSTLRATNVVRYMILHHNFPASRLSAAGYADTHPIAHNGTAEGRALNRRIEIHVGYDDEYGLEPN